MRRTMLAVAMAALAMASIASAFPVSSAPNGVVQPQPSHCHMRGSYPDRTPFVGPPRVRVGGGYGSRSKVAAGAVGSDRGLAGDRAARRTRDRRRVAERSEA